MILNSARRPKLRDLLLTLYGLDFLLGLVTCVFGALWFFQIPVWGFAVDDYEATIAIVGGLLIISATASVVVRHYLVSRGDNAVVTTSTDSSIEPWMRTNHSQSVIRYVSLLEDDKALIAEPLHRHYRSLVKRLCFGSRIDEASGSVNYRIKPFSGVPLLCRVHTRIKSEMTLKTLHAIQRHIYDSGIFSNSRLNDTLLPIQSDDGSEYVQYDERYVVLFPFAENVTHYSGATLAELENLAHNYGLVQKALQSIDNNLDIDALSHTRPSISWFRGDDYLFELVYENNRRAANTVDADQFVTTFRDHAEFLKSCWEEVEPLISRNERHPTPLLHDFHPHNTFFEGEQCLLIYDFEAVSHYWSEAEAVAFALHRYIREFVRLERKRGNSQAVEGIRHLGQSFLNNYSQGRGSLPSGIAGNVGVFIKKTNLAKLTEIMAWRFGLLGEDPGGRRRETMYTELRKFIMYLLEAEYFRCL